MRGEGYLLLLAAQGNIHILVSLIFLYPQGKIHGDEFISDKAQKLNRDKKSCEIFLWENYIFMSEFKMLLLKCEK